MIMQHSQHACPVILKCQSPYEQIPPSLFITYTSFHSSLVLFLPCNMSDLDTSRSREKNISGDDARAPGYNE